MGIEITEIFYPNKRAEWRAWLETHHQTKREIWLRRFRKATGEPCISYDELVEESLCFGWIDGVKKKLDDESNVQRISPRRAKGSFLSELNRQRIWKMQKLGRMTEAGVIPVRDQIGSPDDPFEIPDWILEQLRENRDVWKNFEAFPLFYQRLRISWIGGLPEKHRDVAQQRLDYLIKMTEDGKRYGTEPLAE